MALIKCKECGNMVSDRAEACPKCGCPIGSATQSQPQREYVANDNHNHTSNSGNSNKNGVLWLFLIFAIVAIIIFLLSGKACTGPQESELSISTDVDTTAVKAVDDYTSDDTKPDDKPIVERADNNSSSSNYVVHSEDLYSNDIGGDYGTNYGDKSAMFNNTWLEHDVDGGIRIHANMTTSNLLGQQLAVACFFWFEDGRKINSTDGQYEAPDRQVCTTVNVTPNYQECNWSDLKLWIPYSQIKSARDWKHLKCRVEVFYNHHCLATSNHMHFGCWRE